MEIFDVLGIGFGPANIAVAVANEELGANLRIRYFEKNKTSAWQVGMQFGQSDIQNHPLRDLATPRNPRSAYSFTNFLHTKGRLYEFLNLGKTYALRTEYSQYIEWVAQHFSDCVAYETAVQSVECVRIDGQSLYKLTTGTGGVFYGRALLAAPGRTPYMPAPFDQLDSPSLIHLNDFIPTLEKRRGQPLGKIAVVGGSQSAVEILLHLADIAPDSEVYGFSRAFGYRMKDASPFTGEVYFPQFVDTYYAGTREQKKRLDRDLRYTNYSAADADVLDALYLKIYQQKLAGKEKTVIVRSSDILAAQKLGSDRVRISYTTIESAGVTDTDFDLVILATGFKNLGASEGEEKFPAILADVVPFAATDADGVIQVNQDYSIVMKEGLPHAPCYLNGLCENSHGMGDAGSFSLLALRSAVIVNGLLEQLASQAARPLEAKAA